MEITYSKNVLWLRPYVEAVKDIVDLTKIRTIRGYKVPLTRNPTCDGITTKFYRKKGHLISIRIWEKDGEKHLRAIYEHIVDTLAHELAHIGEVPYGSHSPDHYKMKCRIALRFATVMKKEGIEDHSVRFSPKIEQKHIEKNEKAEGELA
jgi:hypothetical protein